MPLINFKENKSSVICFQQQFRCRIKAKARAKKKESLCRTWPINHEFYLLVYFILKKKDLKSTLVFKRKIKMMTNIFS